VKKHQVKVKRESRRPELGLLLDTAEKRFKGKRPSTKELGMVIETAGFGVGEGVAIGTLLWTMWTYFFPRSGKPKCAKAVPGGRCGAEFQTADRVPGYLEMVCTRGHLTRRKIREK